MIVRGINYATFYDILLDLKKVATVWYFLLFVLLSLFKYSGNEWTEYTTYIQNLLTTS